MQCSQTQGTQVWVLPDDQAVVLPPKQPQGLVAVDHLQASQEPEVSHLSVVEALYVQIAIYLPDAAESQKLVVSDRMFTVRGLVQVS